MNDTILVLRKCGDCGKAQIPMAVTHFPLPIEFNGQVFHFIKDSYSFTCQLFTGVGYPSSSECEIDFFVTGTREHPVLIEL